MNTTSSALFSWAQAMNARQAWALLAAGVLGYEVVCKDGQLLSECVDEWLVSRPILTRAAIAALALHLGNAVPQRYDVVSLGSRRSEEVHGIGNDQIGELKCGNFSLRAAHAPIIAYLPLVDQLVTELPLGRSCPTARPKPPLNSLSATGWIKSP